MEDTGETREDVTGTGTETVTGGGDGDGGGDGARRSAVCF